MSVVTQGIRDLVKKAISDNTVMVIKYLMNALPSRKLTETTIDFQ